MNVVMDLDTVAEHVVGGKRVVVDRDLSFLTRQNVKDIVSLMTIHKTRFTLDRPSVKVEEECIELIHELYNLRKVSANYSNLSNEEFDNVFSKEKISALHRNMICETIDLYISIASYVDLGDLAVDININLTAHEDIIDLDVVDSFIRVVNEVYATARFGTKRHLAQLRVPIIEHMYSFALNNELPISEIIEEWAKKKIARFTTC